MILSLIVIAAIAGLAYLWMMRGFFNAFLHLVCVLIAGAFAFAAWEPASYALLGVLPKTGTFGFLQGMSWGIGLIVPFAISTILLRVLVEMLVPKNLTLATPAEYAGGLVCGAASSTIAVGIFVLGLGNMPLSSSFIGYQPVWYNADRNLGVGSLKLKDSLIFPADKLTANLYRSLSAGAFGSAQPLAKWYPQLHAVGFASRISTGEGQGRNTLEPRDFRLLSSYTVGDTRSGTPASELLKDIRNTEIAQPYADIQGEPVSIGWLAGFVVRFEPGAKERGEKGAGPVSISNGQIRLVVQHESGETTNVFPLAAISQAKAGGDVYGRWRYDSDGVHIASVGGANTAVMAFEFLLKPGDKPLGLFVKNIRVNLEISAPSTTVEYATVDDRDAVVTNGDILTGGKAVVSSLDLADAVTSAPDENIRVSDSIGRTVKLQTIKRFFSVSSEGNLIASGEGQFGQDEVARRLVGGFSPNLLVKSFGIADDQRLVQVDVGSKSPASVLGTVARLQPGNVPMRLIDQNGTEFDAVGFIYEDEKIWKLRYTPSAPIKGLDETPSLTNSRDDQKLTILFVVSKSISIKYLAIGDKVIVAYSPEVIVN